MRRWEFDQGTSSKFWEAEASDDRVTVRYGRLGTQGQEQHKEFADAAVAQAYLDRTIAQKERKGYQEVTTGSPAATAGPAASGRPATPPATQPSAKCRTDDDAFALPVAWRKQLYPRRGGMRRTPAAPGAAGHARTSELLRDREHWTPATFSERTDPALVEAALAHLEGQADPFGAAVIGTMATTVDIDRTAVVDAWAALYGLPFAACGVLDMLDLHVAWVHQRDPRLDRLAHSLGARSMALFRGADSPAECWELSERGSTVAGMAGPIHPSVGAVTESPLPLRHGRREALDRVRELLAACDEETYQETLTRLAGRRGGFQRKVAVAYLAPTETAWVADCLADVASVAGATGDLRALLRCLPLTADQIAALTEHDREPATLAECATVAEGAGTAVEELIVHGLELWGSRSYDKPTHLRRALLAISTDRSFSWFLERAGDKEIRPYIVRAIERYPVRALRLLARAAAADGPGSAAHVLLVSHIGTHPDLTAAHLPALDARAAETVRDILGASARLPGATDLPELLVDPPWNRPRKAVRPLTVTGLTPAGQPQEAWLPGEREEWAATPCDYVPWPWPGSMQYDERLLREGLLSNEVRNAGWYMELPEDRILPLLNDWAPEYFYGQEVLRPFLAKFGLDVHTFLVRLATREPQITGHLLMPFVSSDIARLMADWLVRLKASAATARGWLDRNGPRAAQLLVPDAVGKAGHARRAAESALRHIARRHGDTVVREAAAGYGEEEAAAAVGQLTDTADPLLDALPRTMPKPPDWADPGLLPQIEVRTGGTLPADATRHVVTMLALCKPGAPYPGLDVVEETCVPASLAEFTWRLFLRWRQAHMPAKESWALTVLGRFGDDETVRRLAPVIRAWPGESAHRRAVEGLDVLAEIGTDVALTHLHAIAQRVQFPGLKQRAGERIGEVAEGLGLTTDQLADRLVPDLGLDADGTTVIDYGPRRFTVGFDEVLRPYVLDGDGKRRKDLPKPAAADDTDLATAERKRFSALKKDVRTVAADRIGRLETAMVRGGTWTASEFCDLFAHQTLMRHLARRLVWLSAHASGDRTFRVAEDATFADQHDDAFDLPEDTMVRVPHPMHLDGDVLGAWQEVFADYEILQPFRQLDRPVLAFTPEEVKAWELTRFAGQKVVLGTLLALTKRGWRRMEVMDAGHFGGITKELAPGQVVSVIPGEGLNINDIEYAATVELSEVWISGYEDDFVREGDVRFGDVDPLTASELLLDLTFLTQDAD
ncbi:WGR and DUF4132 domain-containing protein [Streptomyces sp. NPDC057301]|uniref:WGR and DUF4132 domain-containing protein n=1 Tax=Streptomyces sp. NPDC057301 TaxID=3346093 RepID=UPI00363D24B3